MQQTVKYQEISNEKVTYKERRQQEEILIVSCSHTELRGEGGEREDGRIGERQRREREGGEREGGEGEETRGRREERWRRERGEEREKRGRIKRETEN